MYAESELAIPQPLVFFLPLWCIQSNLSRDNLISCNKKNMASTEQIRSNLIDKLISIKNKELVSAVDRLLEVSVTEEDF